VADHAVRRSPAPVLRGAPPEWGGGRLSCPLRLLPAATAADRGGRRPGSRGRGLRKRRGISEADRPDAETDRTDRACGRLGGGAAAASARDPRRAAEQD